MKVQGAGKEMIVKEVRIRQEYPISGNEEVKGGQDLGRDIGDKELTRICKFMKSGVNKDIEIHEIRCQGDGN